MSPKPGPEHFDQKVVEEANRAWLAAFFASPATHRTNAQAGYTVAAAVAAAVVGAGILASVGSAPWWLQIAAVVTLGLWLCAAWEFMRAVAIQPNYKGPVHERTPAELAEGAIQRTWTERSAIARRSWQAQQLARLAGIATFLTIVIGMVSAGSGDSVDATVVLTPAGSRHYAELCGQRSRVVTGRLDPGDLGDEFVAVDVSGCDGDATVRLVRREIAAVRSP
jgi:hypothetical protein